MGSLAVPACKSFGRSEQYVLHPKADRSAVNTPCVAESGPLVPHLKIAHETVQFLSHAQHLCLSSSSKPLSRHSFAGSAYVKVE